MQNHQPREKGSERSGTPLWRVPASFTSNVESYQLLEQRRRKYTAHAKQTRRVYILFFKNVTFPVGRLPGINMRRTARIRQMPSLPFCRLSQDPLRPYRVPSPSKLTVENVILPFLYTVPTWRLDAIHGQANYYLVRPRHRVCRE